MEALSLVAVFADTETEDATNDAHFWIALLLDDVTHDMLLSRGSSVRVTWLNKVGDSDAGAAKKKNRYEYAYDDALEVDSILCHVFALECADGSVEVTAKSIERVRATRTRERTH